METIHVPFLSLFDWSTILSVLNERLWPLFFNRSNSLNERKIFSVKKTPWKHFSKRFFSLRSIERSSSRSIYGKTLKFSRTSEREQCSEVKHNDWLLRHRHEFLWIDFTISHSKETFNIVSCSLYWRWNQSIERVFEGVRLLFVYLRRSSSVCEFCYVMHRSCWSSFKKKV